jgi:ABC-type multidrug transport system fused ATPase/permease subunit
MVQWAPPDLLSSIQVAVTFVLMYALYRQGTISLGTAVMINSYIWLSFRPLRVISNQMEDLQKAGAGLVRVHDLLQERSNLHDPSSPVAIPDGPLAVEFDHVRFAYDERRRTEDETGVSREDSSFVWSLPSSGAKGPSSETVLPDLSFRLAPGTVLGLLGRTGSGKTTISRLLFRLYDPADGAIRLGGVDLRAARREQLRQRIGMVTQDVQLFRATVRHNVTFFDDAIPDAHILAAMDDLGLGDWYRALPDGLDTILGAGGGAGVSAGEAQLLAFTRVFLKDPGLVLLDEASSRLDPATERLIERAVGRLLTGRTGIIIAHRLATIQRADEVMVLERGRIAEYGPRAGLAADPASRFATLLRTGLEHERAPALAEVLA